MTAALCSHRQQRWRIAAPASALDAKTFFEQQEWVAGN
jgi:hypothetical protein